MRYIMRRSRLVLGNDCGYSFYRVWAEEKKEASGNRYIVACIWRTDRIAIKRSD